MDKEEYAYLMEYCTPRSILVVTWYGKLKELYCPFGVRIRENIHGLRKGNYTQVDYVLLSENGELVFNIGGRNYFYHHFDILTNL